MNGVGLDVEFLAERAIVTLSGDLDVPTVAILAGVLNAVVDDGHRDLVVDVGRVTSMTTDARGVVARLSLRLAELGGTISVRSASEATRRVFELGGMGELVVDEALDSDLAASGSGALLQTRTGVVDAALRLVTTLAASTLTNADGASVTLERHGRLMTVAASDDEVKVMDRHQYDSGEGPCLSAKADGRWYYIDSLADETRWPKFVPLALEQGIHSILSSPLMTKDRPQGALNIYSSTPRAFSTHDQELAALFSEQASAVLTAAAPDEIDEEASQRLGRALTARQMIHQAQGVLMERDRLGVEDSVAALHRAARATGTTVLAYATGVVASIATDESP
jgi:anti-anti-sigma factor